MILISHRGNINGKNDDLENKPHYIDSAIEQGYEVEIDLWVENNNIILGHDLPQYEINLDWIKCRSKKLWVHCKNHEAVSLLSTTRLNFFWHQDDDFTITSLGFIWSHPSIEPIKNSIAVLPEINKQPTNNCIGICSDNIIMYRDEIK